MQQAKQHVIPPLPKKKLRQAKRVGQIPLCVDLDGTLVNTDIFLENVLSMFKKNPWQILRFPLWLLRGKSYVKNKVLNNISIDFSALPYNEKLIQFLKKRSEEGQKLILVTGSTREVALGVAKHLNIFEEVHATHKKINLTAENKAFFLRSYYGAGQYDYVGNERADLPVWKTARTSYLVNTSNFVTKKAYRIASDVKILDAKVDVFKAFIKSLRTHQWLKNILVFVPLLLANRLGMNEWIQGLMAFMSFSLVASSGYVFNDLLDINSDRKHVSKKKRPFAAGILGIDFGIMMIPTLLLGSILLAIPLGLEYLSVVVLYFGLTLSYSIWIKKFEVADVIVLAGFYSLRLYAGALATNIPVSSWLIAFTTFLFLSLALMKRSSELIEKIEIGGKETLSRGYRLNDHPLLRSLGSTSGYLSVVVFGLYIQSPAVYSYYKTPDYLWGICILLVYWISRFWVLANRGKVDYDPVFFAAKDRVTHIIAALMAVCWLLARGIS